MLTWDHTGFSVDASVKVMTGDWGRLRRLVRYMAQPPISVERCSYDASSGKVTVLSAKQKHGQRPVVATYDVISFLALLALQAKSPGGGSRHLAHI